MAKRSFNRVDPKSKESDDSFQEITNIKILESPWNLWNDVKQSDCFFRTNLSKTLYYTLQIRLFRDYIKKEFSKNRSRKGAAVKRAYSYSKNDAKKIIDTLGALDLNQLWNALDTRSSFDPKSFNDRLEAVLSTNIDKILKNDLSITSKYTNSNDVYSKNDSQLDSDSLSESSLDDMEQPLSDPEEPLNDEEKSLNDKNSNLNTIEDRFFKFDEMEAFANEQLDPEDDIDYFDSLGEESDDSVAAAEMRYSDFFRDPEGGSGELVEDLKPLTCDRDLNDLDEYDKQMELMLQQLEDQEEGGDENENMYRDELELLDEPEEENEAMEEKEYLNDKDDIDYEMMDYSNINKSIEKSNSVQSENEEDDRITQIEKELVAPKHWSLMGESTGKNRPRNSLLDIELELPQPSSIVYNSEMDTGSIDANGLQVEQTNETVNGQQLPIELVIIQRIKSGVFDNVERKTFIEDQLESLSRLNKNKNEEMKPEEIDFKKSEMGLGEVYAQKYKEQFMAIDKLDPHKKDLSERFAHLIYKLDSLSNSTFVPKRTSVTEKINTVPMISVETPVNIVISGSNDQLGGTNEKDKLLGKNTPGSDEPIEPGSLISNISKQSTMSEKVSRSAKKRKFKNKMKGLIKSGRLTVEQVEKMRQKMVNRNKLRREDSKSKKKTGLTSREMVKHDMKSNRRIDTNKLLSNIGKKF